MSRREDLSAPRQNRRFGVHYDREAFGEFSELIARALGTARYLIFQSIVCFFWLGWNIVLPDGWRFDPNPFGVLTLALSLQAAYAAPLILLAQNRQEDRDSQQLELDRAVAARTQSETEYLARELAGVRMALADVVTMEDLREHLDRLTSAVEKVAEKLDD